MSASSAPLFQLWQPAFMQQVQAASTARPLKEAALNGQLAEWTRHLTAAVVRSCEALGWQAAGKGHPLSLLPQAGQEYLGIDVMAFAVSRASRWPFPLAAFELENDARDDRVAYSLWKVLCLRVGLRVVFAYRPDGRLGRRLVSTLAEKVIGGLEPGERMAIGGETVVVMGNRDEGETFPWGYFKFWLLDRNVGRFEKI